MRSPELTAPWTRSAKLLSVSVTIGLLHPGEMGATLGGALRAAGQTVVWASAERSAATTKRAHERASRTSAPSKKWLGAAR